MNKNKLSVLFVSEEHAIDFNVQQVLDCIIDNIKIDDIEEMYLLDSESVNYFLFSDLDSYTSLREIIQPSFANGALSMFDFDLQLKNGISIYTHENLTIEAEDNVALFKYIDYIFRYFHLDATKSKEIIISSPDEPIEFDVN